MLSFRSFSSETTDFVWETEDDKGLSDSFFSPLTSMLMSLATLHRRRTSEDSRRSSGGFPEEFSFCLFSNRLIRSCTLSLRAAGAVDAEFADAGDSVSSLVGVSFVSSLEFTLVLLRRSEAKLAEGLGFGGSES